MIIIEEKIVDENGENSIDLKVVIIDHKNTKVHNKVVNIWQQKISEGVVEEHCELLFEDIDQNVIKSFIFETKTQNASNML